MVCLGNICRSPLAEGILRSKVDASRVLIDSAGTGGWHVGHLPDVRSIEVAQAYGIDIRDQRCRRFSTQDFADFDLIYVMDQSNLSNVLDQAQRPEDHEKVKLILDELYPGEMREVPDPYYDRADGFEKVFRMLDEACDVIANRLVNEF